MLSLLRAQAVALLVPGLLQFPTELSLGLLMSPPLLFRVRPQAVPLRLYLSKLLVLL